MKSETLIHQPPTPPNVNLDLQNSLRQTAQFNADRGIPYDESHVYGAEYGSPGPTVPDGLLRHPSHVESGEAFGMGIQYVGSSHRLGGMFG